MVDDVESAGEIGRLDFPPMRVAEVVLSGDIALEVRAIDWLYKTWLPRSGYVPDDQPAFEAWIGRPFAHGNEHFELACQLPVKPAWATALRQPLDRVPNHSTECAPLHPCDLAARDLGR